MTELKIENKEIVLDGEIIEADTITNSTLVFKGEKPINLKANLIKDTVFRLEGMASETLQLINYLLNIGVMEVLDNQILAKSNSQKTENELWRRLPKDCIYNNPNRKMADKDPEYFMQEAAKTVSQRGTDNGYDAGQERSAAAVAEMFNSMYPDFDLNEDHVWAIMLSVKLVRNARKPREDNIVDLIGYAGLLGESQSAPKKVKPSLHEKRGPSMSAREKSDLKGIFLVPRFEGIDAAPYKVAEDYPHNVAETHDSFLFDGLYFLKSRWTLKEYK